MTPAVIAVDIKTNEGDKSRYKTFVKSKKMEFHQKKFQL